MGPLPYTNVLCFAVFSCENLRQRNSQGTNQYVNYVLPQVDRMENIYLEHRFGGWLAFDNVF